MYESDEDQKDDEQVVMSKPVVGLQKKRSNIPKMLGQYKQAAAFLVFALLFGTIGVKLLTGSHAATPLTSTSLPTPTNVAVNNVSTTKAALTWSPVSTAGVSYKVLRNGTVVGTTDAHTTNYLDTGLTPGTAYVYTVAAQKSTDSSLPSTPLSVTTGAKTTVLKACGVVSTSGDYVLNADLTGVSNPVKGGPPTQTNCLTFSGITKFSLDCKNHIISMSGLAALMIEIDNSTNFQITDCNLVDTQPNDNYTTIYVNNSKLGTIQKNNFGQSSALYSNQSSFTSNLSANLVVEKNNFTTSTYIQDSATNNYVGQNKFTWDNLSSKASPANLNSSLGSGNIIYNNTIDGGSTTPAQQTTSAGTDDGITFGAASISPIGVETNDYIGYNQISNEWDAGIESVGKITGTTITHNTITNTAFSAIGSYFYTDWQNNVVSYNTYNDGVNNTVFMTFLNGLTFPAGSPQPSFQNNKFLNNTLKPTAGTLVQGLTLNFTSSPTSYALGNNLVKDNDFSHSAASYAPFIDPVSMVVDGGGNICLTTNQTLPGHVGIVCN